MNRSACRVLLAVGIFSGLAASTGVACPSSAESVVEWFVEAPGGYYGYYCSRDLPLAPGGSVQYRYRHYLLIGPWNVNLASPAAKTSGAAVGVLAAMGFAVRLSNRRDGKSQGEGDGA